MRITTLLFFSLIFSGCAMYPVSIFDSSQPIEGRKYTVIGPVEENGCDGYGFGIFGNPGEATASNVLKKALKKHSADAIIGGTLDVRSINLILGSEICAYLKGTAIKFND